MGGAAVVFWGSRMRDLENSGQGAELDRQVDPAKAPGRTTRVEVEGGRGPSAAPAGPGKRTLVESMGGHMLEGAIADAQKHTGELKAALAGQDRTKTKESAGVLESALGIIRESVGNAGPNQGADGMRATIEIFATAEPLLAQARAKGAADPSADPKAVAARETQGPGQALPFQDQIQRSFGRHDVSHIEAHTGPQASASADAMGARAYTSGSSVAFAGTPDLHTAAHEAAHVVQQQGGVQLKALDGGSGDAHERHADAVADAVVAGNSAESLLDRGPSGGAPAVQRKESGPGPAGGKPEEKDRGGRPAKGAAKAPKPPVGGAGVSGSVTKGGAKNVAGGGGGAGPGFGAGGGLQGDAIKAQLTQFSAVLKSQSEAVQQPAGTGGAPKKDSAEDHAKKVEQYEDGIDGIADQIGDLDGFDTLCAGYSDWGEDKDKQQQGLREVQSSKAFHRLSQMWQGALDGGEDSARMQAAFDREFTSRGFFGSTQRAYAVVCNAAKVQAKDDAEAAAAKKKAKEAKDKSGKDAADATKAAGAKAGEGKGTAIDGGAGGAGSGGGLNAQVAPEMPPIAGFTELSRVTDADFGKLMASADVHAGLNSENKNQGELSRRNDQILDQLKLAGSGFKKGFVDTAKWGIVAHFGDKLVGGAAEKLLGEKVPIVGPLIMIAMDPPWKGEYWKGVGTGLGKGGHDFASAFSLDAWKNVHGVKDFVGVLCAKLADLFSGFYEILSVISKLVNTLSAVCMILGAILIAIGCALFIFGGGTLIAAGGWLVEAGEVLGDIGLALMPICLALSGIALLFRTIAAYTVPSEVYAEQLAAEGQAANTFGDQAGTRVGLSTARAVEEATPNAPKPQTASDAAGGGGPANAEGAADAQNVEGTTKQAGDAMAKVETAAKEAGAKDQPKTEAQPEAKADAKPETKPEAEHAPDESKAKQDAKQESAKDEAKDPPKDEAKEDKGGKDEAKDAKDEAEDKKDAKDDDATKAKKESVGKKFAKSLGKQLAEAVKSSVSVRRHIGRLIEDVKAVKGLGDYKTASERGLAKHIDHIEAKAKEAGERIKELQAEATKAQEELDAHLAELVKGEGTLSPEQVGDLNKQVTEAMETAHDARAKAEELKARFHEAVEAAKRGEEQERMPDEEEREGSSAEDENGSPTSTKAKLGKAENELKETRVELEKARDEKEHAVDEAKEASEAVAEAKSEKAKVDTEKAEAAKDPKNKSKVEAAKKVADVEAAKARAAELSEKAGRIKSAESARKRIEGALKKTVDQKVEVNGEPRKIVSVGPEGVTVEPLHGGAQETVKPEDVKGEHLPDDFNAQIQSLAKTKAEIATEMGDEKANAGAYADKLEADANRIRKDVRKNFGTPKKDAKWSKTKADAEEWNAPSEKAEDAVTEAQKELDKKNVEVQKAHDEEQHLEEKATELDNETARLRRAKHDHRRTEAQMEKGAEIVAAALGLDRFISAAFDGGWELVVGGLEKAYEKAKDVIVGHEEKQPDKYAVLSVADEGDGKKAGEEKDAAKDGKDDEKSKDEPKQPDAPASDAKPADDAKAAADKEPGGKEPAGEGEPKSEEAEYAEMLEEAKKKAEASGKKEDMFEQLLVLRPPTDLALLADHRTKATEAAAKAKASHEWAYKCYQAELAVTRLATQAEEMAESGKPMHKRAQDMRGPIEKSKGDEKERASQLAGSSPGDVKGADSQMGGLVVQLISKLADHSDRLSQKPDGGGVKGEDMAAGQDKAAQQSEQRTSDMKSHSAAQQQFLDQALELRGRQEASVAKDIQSLQGKSREEFAIRDQIRQHKAQAIADEKQASDEASAEAGVFNEGYARATTWQTAFETKRKALKDAGSGGE